MAVVLNNNFTLPAGHVNQLRLALGPHNTIITTGGVFALTIPSGAETGLKVNIDRDLFPEASGFEQRRKWRCSNPGKQPYFAKTNFPVILPCEKSSGLCSEFGANPASMVINP